MKKDNLLLICGNLSFPKRKTPPSILYFFILATLIFHIFPQESSSKHNPSSCQKEQISVPEKNNVKEIAYLLKKGDSIYNVLTDFNLNPGEIFQVIAATKKIYNINRIKMGQSVHITIDEKENCLLGLKYDIDNQRTLIVQKGISGFETSIKKITYEIARETFRGTVESSFFVSAVQGGMSPQVILNLADIFSGEIDFHTDIRSGDSFRLVFEKRYLNGEFAGYGKILAAEFTNNKNNHTAIFFEDKNGQRDYYDLAGKSLRRKFLRSPLRYRRISSRFSHRRLHPILKIYRPHLGIDYAAPIGTPIVATAHGKIIYSGWKGGYGKFIKIKHDRIYVSTYGHLSRFARGMKPGKYVKQGQVIGYVGSTGHSTGPHHDYRLLKRGTYVNPLRIKTSSLKRINKNDQTKFDKVKTEVLLALNKTEPLMLTSYIPGTYHLIP